MRIHEINLKLEFQRVCPIIITFAETYILPFAMTGHYLIYFTRIPLIDILFLIDGLDDIRVSLGILADNVSCAIRRSIIMNNGHKGEISLLHDDAIKTLAYKTLMIVGKNLNRNL